MDFPPGLHNRGMCFAYGTGVPKDPDRAVQLISRAAALGEPNAAYALGQAYRNGTFGVAADARKARRCFERAADLGHEEAAAILASAYAWPGALDGDRAWNGAALNPPV